MSYEYDLYLHEHVSNVQKAYEWLRNHFGSYLLEKSSSYQNISEHDKSKYDEEEYDAYDVYFYSKNRSYSVVDDFNRAWLRHIHKNPHHWQHWVLVNDDQKEGTVALEIPFQYVVEMVCDWWSFSWKSGNLYEIFDWYEDHKKQMILHDNTRAEVERLLSLVKDKLDETIE